MVILRKSGRLLARIFFQGLAVMLPIAITAFILYWLAATTETLLGTFFHRLFPDLYRPGMGMVLGLVIIFAAGLMMRTWATRALIGQAEAVLNHIPLVKTIYGSVRDLAAFLSPGGKGEKFERVVSVTFGENVRLVGFVTCEDTSGLPSELAPSEDTVGVYLPMSYQIGGFTVFVPKAAVQALPMSVEDAMRFTLTAGMSGPHNDADDAEAEAAAPQHASDRAGA